MEATFDTPLPVASSSAARWTGRALSGLPVAFLGLDAAMKMIHVQAVTDASAQLGRIEEARAEFSRAASLTENVRQRERLLERASRLEH